MDPWSPRSSVPMDPWSPRSIVPFPLVRVSIKYYIAISGSVVIIVQMHVAIATGARTG